VKDTIVATAVSNYAATRFPPRHFLRPLRPGSLISCSPAYLYTNDRSLYQRARSVSTSATCADNDTDARSPSSPGKSAAGTVALGSKLESVRLCNGTLLYRKIASKGSRDCYIGPSRSTKEAANGDSDPTWYSARDNSIKKTLKMIRVTLTRNGLLRSSAIKNRLPCDIKLSRYHEVLKKYIVVKSSRQETYK